MITLNTFNLKYDSLTQSSLEYRGKSTIFQQIYNKTYNKMSK